MSLKEKWAMEAGEARDPNEINQHLKVTFEETIGEPDHTHSIDCVWKFSYKCFNLWKTLYYLICTTLCAIPMASCWGCAFACIAIEHIWCITPSLKVLQIQLSVAKRLYALWVDSFCAPCFDAMGHIFNAFRRGPPDSPSVSV